MNSELIEIIKKIKDKISDNSDMSWTPYKNAKQLRDELDTNAQKFKLGDTSSLEDLKNLFLPTAALQEHAISNGWSDDYLKLAAKFDNIYSKMQNRS